MLVTLASYFLKKQNNMKAGKVPRTPSRDPSDPPTPGNPHVRLALLLMVFKDSVNSHALVHVFFFHVFKTSSLAGWETRALKSRCHRAVLSGCAVAWCSSLHVPVSVSS